MKSIEEIERDNLFLSPALNRRTLSRMMGVAEEEIDRLFMNRYGFPSEEMIGRMRLAFARRLILEYGISFEKAVLFSGFTSRRNAKKALAALDY